MCSVHLFVLLPSCSFNFKLFFEAEERPSFTFLSVVDNLHGSDLGVFWGCVYGCYLFLLEYTFKSFFFSVTFLIFFSFSLVFVLL